MTEYTQGTVINEAGHAAIAYLPTSPDNCRQGDLLGPIEVNIGGESRMVLGGLAAMAAAINANPSASELNHDCFVFAASFRAGVYVPDRPFDSRSVDMRLRKPPHKAADSLGRLSLLFPGSIIFALNDKKQNHHFMIKGSTDNKEPLFFSKFGRSGRAVVHRFADAATFYGSTQFTEISIQENKGLFTVTD